MALIRPVVLVFQELATPTVTPSTPDLNCLVVGPAYFIQDYFAPGTTNYADKSSIQIATAYGALEASPDTATPVGPAVITIAEPPNNVAGAILDAASAQVYFDQVRAIIATGTKGTTSASTPNQFDTAETSPTTFNTAGPGKVNPGDRVIITDGANVIARTVYTVESDTRLHFTQDIPGAGFTPGANQHWRIERRVNDVAIDSSFFHVNGNVVTIDGGVTVTVTGQGAKTVSYAVVYLAYRSLRQDLQVLDTVESEAEILAKIGRLDARDPLGVGAFVALQNTTSKIQFVGVPTNDLAGHVSVRDSLAARPDVYAIVPLTADVSVIAMWNTDCVGLAVPDETRGRPQRFRVVIGSGTLPVTQTVTAPSGTGQPQQVAGSSSGAITKFTIPGIDMITGGVIPGDIIHVTLDTAGTPRNGSYAVAAVIDATHVEVDPAVVIPFAGTGNATVEIRHADDVAVRIAATAITGLVSAAADDYYLILKDSNAAFVTDGALPGDIIQIPSDPASSSFTGTLTSFVVAQVLSENRIQIVNNGQDSSLVENELPHGVKRIGSAVVPATTVHYRVVRSYSKDGQVLALVAQAQSFRSKRTILVWPDVCDVAGVVDGTAQPGYYLSCAVGGMTAGLPSQQGFTNLGIAGISQITHANTYFTDSQMTDLSNGGWYVFAQQTPVSLPHTIHQLTTDPTTLESGEFSVVKNFDFVALFFVDILEAFLGVYNVTPDALVLLRGALNTGGEVLLLRTVAKIGAPLTSFAINDLGVSPVSGDRVVAHLAIGLPKPLNVIELHLVA